MKEKFKEFVKNNPKLVDYVKNNNKNWQDLFEIYVLYGEDEKIWDNYSNNNKTGIEDLVKMIQNVNLDAVKNTVDSLSKAVGILKNISSDNKEEIYERKQSFKDLDD